MSQPVAIAIPRRQRTHHKSWQEQLTTSELLEHCRLLLMGDERMDEHFANDMEGATPETLPFIQFRGKGTPESPYYSSYSGSVTALPVISPSTQGELVVQNGYKRRKGAGVKGTPAKRGRSSLPGLESAPSRTVILTLDCELPDSATPADGYSWRKYGQKLLHNSPPISQSGTQPPEGLQPPIPQTRSYYKCSYKDGLCDIGADRSACCPAQKRVYRYVGSLTAEMRRVFKVVYTNEHIHPPTGQTILGITGECRNGLENTQSHRPVGVRNEANQPVESGSIGGVAQGHASSASEYPAETQPKLAAQQRAVTCCEEVAPRSGFPNLLENSQNECGCSENLLLQSEELNRRGGPPAWEPHVASVREGLAPTVEMLGSSSQEDGPFPYSEVACSCQLAEGPLWTPSGDSSPGRSPLFSAGSSEEDENTLGNRSADERDQLWALDDLEPFQVGSEVNKESGTVGQKLSMASGGGIDEDPDVGASCNGVSPAMQIGHPNTARGVSTFSNADPASARAATMLAAEPGIPSPTSGGDLITIWETVMESGGNSLSVTGGSVAADGKEAMDQLQTAAWNGLASSPQGELLSSPLPNDDSMLLPEWGTPDLLESAWAVPPSP